MVLKEISDLKASAGLARKNRFDSKPQLEVTSVESDNKSREEDKDDFDGTLDSTSATRFDTPLAGPQIAENTYA